MKCELCHEHEAETAITVRKAGAEEELYVCQACAKKERVRKQKKSQRTRKVVDASGEEAPPFIAALIDAVDGLFSMAEGEIRKEEAASESSPRPEVYHTLPCDRADEHYRIGSRIHLEGLHMVGDLEAVHRALHALGMKLVGIYADGVTDTGHVYDIQYQGSAARAKRIAEALLTQERNARVRLVHSLPRLFSDSICRSLAILKNCRLLSSGELFDMLSPLRLAAYNQFLDGITLEEIKTLAGGLDLNSREDDMEPSERDRLAAERADEINARFEDVVLNERGEQMETV